MSSQLVGTFSFSSLRSLSFPRQSPNGAPSRPDLSPVVDRYQVRRYKASQVLNTSNDWATEHDKPTYTLDLASVRGDREGLS